MLTFHVLNVGHGDSTIVQYNGPDGVQFGVIDSNCIAPGIPPALAKLQQLGAENLSFVALSHPHADHYKGMAELLSHYKNQIGGFYTFPLHRHVVGRVHKLGKICQQLYATTKSETIRGNAMELVKILHMALNDFPDEWWEPTGHSSPIAPIGFKGVEVNVLLPLPKEKGAFFTAIENSSIDILKQNERENNISLAFQFKYAGQEVIIGGDGTFMNWWDQKRLMDRAGTTLEANVVRLPHHGAREDCKDPVMPHLFSDQSPRYAIVSANGHSHPSRDTYEVLKKMGITPYCTNLARQCGATLRELVRAPELTPVLERLINSVLVQPTDRAVQACQGDIAIQISAQGKLSVLPQFNHPCPYRGGYDFLNEIAKPGDTIH